MMKLRAAMFGFSVALLLNASGCHQDMYDQKKYVTLSASEFYRDGQAARPRIEGTVVHRDHSDDGVISTGRINGKPVEVFPFAVTESVIRRGQERFNIFCSPCHGRTGDGRGIVVERGFPQPPSYFTDSVRARPVGHFVNVIANGFGRMYSYGDRVDPRDRWAIAAYIRVLQASRAASITELTNSERVQLK